MNNEITIDSYINITTPARPYRHKELVEELLLVKNPDYQPNTIPLL